jgi:UDP-2-acetamido-3-amino-2,3-dideoxy-glucuronate N-acetyltransferase
MPGSITGANCTIGQNVFIDNGVVIGNGVKIQNNVSLYNGVLVEDDVFLGPSVVFTNVINPRSFIERKNEFKQTVIRKGASIGANSTVICGVEIGTYALIGAGALVSRRVPAYSLVFGVPACQRGWVSRAGHKLVFNKRGEASCPVSGEPYLLRENGVTAA